MLFSHFKDAQRQIRQHGLIRIIADRTSGGVEHIASDSGDFFDKDQHPADDVAPVIPRNDDFMSPVGLNGNPLKRLAECPLGWVAANFSNSGY